MRFLLHPFFVLKLRLGLGKTGKQVVARQHFRNAKVVLNFPFVLLRCRPEGNIKVREEELRGAPRLYKALEQIENECNPAHDNLASYEGVKASAGSKQHKNCQQRLLIETPNNRAEAARHAEAGRAAGRDAQGGREERGGAGARRERETEGGKWKIDRGGEGRGGGFRERGGRQGGGEERETGTSREVQSVKPCRYHIFMAARRSLAPISRDEWLAGVQDFDK